MEKIKKVLYFIIVIVFIISVVSVQAWTWNNTMIPIDWCNLQWPYTASIGGVPIDVYGQVYVSGLTDQYNTPAPGLVAEIGYGPYLTDPRVNPKWVWRQAMPNSGSYNFGSNNDEFVGKLDIPYIGIFSYTYRYSVDAGATWTLGDLDGTLNGIDCLNQFGTVTVSVPSSAPPPVPIPPAVFLLELLD